MQKSKELAILKCFQELKKNKLSWPFVSLN